MSTTSTSSTSSVYGIGSAFSTTSTSSSSSTSVASSLDANSFLTLFCAELTNQDPTNPMQSYELAAQLAQFTTVQELTQSNTYLKNIQQYASTLNNGEITSLVGKDVSAQTSDITVSSGSVSDLSYTLSSAATSVTVTIANSSGTTVDTIDVGSKSAGTYTVPWTGTDSSGSTESDGTYTCTVTATDSSGTSSTVATYVTGTVYSCDLSSTPPTYTLTSSSGKKVKVSEVFAVANSS